MLDPDQDIADRRPVWEALASMFLDTDTSLSRASRVDTLNGSKYSLDEIEAILVHEVGPICKWNLMTTAGEWSGFDMEWLEERILRRVRSPFRIMRRMNLGMVYPLVRAEWAETRLALKRRRETGAQFVA